MRQRTRLLCLFAVLTPALGLVAWAAWPPAAAPAPARDYDVSARPPDLIAPGTVVDRTAPAGWSHLVRKCLPRLRDADRPKVNDLVARMSGWMFTAFAADVKPDPARPGKHAIRAVGLGLGTAHNGKDVVVTPDTAGKLGIDLGLFGPAILSKGYERQGTAVVVLHGPTMWVVDTPVCYQCGGGNRYVWYRYALLTDGPSGALDALVWRVDPAGAACGDPSGVVWLKPDAVDAPELTPDLSQFSLLGVPSDTGLAVFKLPPGKWERPLPPDLRGLADKNRFTPAEARGLEDALRRMLDTP